MIIQRLLGLLSSFLPMVFFAQQDTISVKVDHSFQVVRISDEVSFRYEKPKIWDAVNKIPKNLVGTAKDIVSKPYYPYSIGAVALTGLLIPMDPWLIEEGRRLGNSLGLSEDHHYGKLGFLKIVPQDAASAIYFVGNGTTVILIGAGFATYGLLKNDYRAQSTALQLMESLAQSGIFAQTIKRLSGRESPFITFGDQRRHSYWRFAPSFSAYQKNTSSYDAMPSGHLTTAMAALTVISENYPEYKWLKPVGYSILGLMSFEMVQSKVHWASDYPIALLLGYLIGKNIANSRIVKTQDNKAITNKTQYKLSFSASSLQGYQVVGLNVDF